MTRRSAAILGIWAASVAGAVAMVLIIAAMLAQIGEGPGLALLFTVLAANSIAYATVGLLISWKRPGNRIAWVLAAAGLLLPVTFIGFAVGATRFLTHGADDAVGGLFGVVAAAAVGPALFTAVPLIAILFPDGRLPGPRWRVPFAIAVALVAVPSAVALVKPGAAADGLPVNPLGIQHDAVAALGAITSSLLPLGILAGAVVAIAAVTTRFRRSAGVERQQVKWLLAAVVVIGTALPASFVDANGESGFSALDMFAIASLALLPVTVGVAVTRHGLYEIDRIISRTLAYAAVTALLAAAFVVTNLALQAVLAGATGSSTLTTAAATLVVAGLFQPVRRRVQAIVDRRFNRAKVDAERVASGLAAEVRDEVDLDRLRLAVVAAADDAVAPTRAALWLRGTR